jgi:TFIIF-interacting CTD phosphatase-like protein
MYEIIVFTAGQKDYADPILDYIDPHKKIFKKRLYRTDCI